MRQRNILIITIVWALLCGCQTEGIYDDYEEFNYTIQIHQGVVIQNGTTGELSLLQVTQDSVARRVLFTPKKGEVIDTIFAGYEAENSDTLNVLTAVADERRTDVYPTLNVINVTNGTVTNYILGSRFSRHRFSPDGQMLILYHGDSDSVNSGLSNPNEIAIIDLSAAPLAPDREAAVASVPNPRSLSVNVQGRTIESIHFLDPVQIGNVETRLVAFVTEGAIQFTNLQSKTLPSVSVSLKNDADSRQIFARHFEVIAGTETHGPRVFVQAENASELYDIELNPRDNDAGFYATTSLLDGGSTPSDFAVLQDAGELYVVSASSQSNVLNVFEASTAHIITLNLSSRVQTIETRTTGGRTELVMYGSGSNRIYFLNETDLASQMGENLETMILQENIERAQMLDNNRLMIYPNTSGLIIADLDSRTVTHLAGNNSREWLNNQLWNNTLFLAGNSKIDFLNILDGTTGFVALDEEIVQFNVFPAQGVGLAIHDTPAGRVTVFPLAQPTRAACKVFDGFLVNGILNRGEE